MVVGGFRSFHVLALTQENNKLVGLLKRTFAILDAVGKACDLPNFHAEIDSASAKNMGDKFTKITIFIIWGAL